MTRSDLIAALAERFPQLVKADAEASVALILGALAETLQRGDRVEIRGFGSFRLNFRPPRIGHNPRTRQPVEIPGKHVPHFVAAKALRELVDRQP